MIINKKLSDFMVASFDTESAVMSIVHTATGSAVILSPVEQINLIDLVEEIVERDIPLYKKT